MTQLQMCGHPCDGRLALQTDDIDPVNESEERCICHANDPVDVLPLLSPPPGIISPTENNEPPPSTTPPTEENATLKADDKESQPQSRHTSSGDSLPQSRPHSSGEWNLVVSGDSVSPQPSEHWTEASEAGACDMHAVSKYVQRVCFREQAVAIYCNRGAPVPRTEFAVVNV